MSVELTNLANTLNAARIDANNCEATAAQSGVYGHVATALESTLGLILGGAGAGADAYQSILDGNTVEQAIAWVAAAQSNAAVLTSGTVVTMECEITGYVRGPQSKIGNPSFILLTTDKTAHKTRTNTSCAYEVENAFSNATESNPCPITLHMTAAGTVIGWHA